MKKLVMCILACSVAFTVKAITQTAFDDFSGGTAGTTISGNSDDYGYTWSTTDRDVVFGPDGQSAVTTNSLGGGAVLEGDF